MFTSFEYFSVLVFKKLIIVVIPVTGKVLLVL